MPQTVTNTTFVVTGASPINYSDTVTLGNGVITFNDPGGTATVTLGVANVIQGFGAIADNTGLSGPGLIDNLGLINAANGQLRITTTGFVNHGTVKTTNGADLRIEENLNRAWTNAAGATISGDAGSTVVLGGPFSNAGAITITGGNLFLDGIFNFGGQQTTWTNTGVITATNSTVHIRGNETVAQIGTINRTGGSLVYEIGTLENTGGALDATTTSLIGLKLDGATIHGGTLNQAGLGLTFSGAAFNTLDAVTVLGGLDVVGGTARLAGGTTVRNAANTAFAQINVSNGNLVLASDAAITLAQTVLLSNGGLTVDTSAGAVQGNLTIGAAGIVRGTGRIFDQSFPWDTSVSLDNLGLIEANGGVLEVSPVQFINHGIMRATNNGNLRIEENRNRVWTNAAGGTITGDAGSTLVLGGPFSNAGAITIDGGNLFLDGIFNFSGSQTTWTNSGTITATNSTVHIRGNETVAQIGAINRTGGSLVYEIGTLDNTGGSLGAATTSLIGLKLDGATIKGGTLNQTGLGLTFSGASFNTLDNVTVLGGLNIVDGTARLAGGTTVKNAANTALGQINVTNGNLVLASDAAQTLAQTVLLSNGGLTVDTSAGAIQGNLTIGAAGIVRGTGRIFDQSFPWDTTVSLDNLGLIEANGGALEVSPVQFINHGIMRATNNGNLRVQENRDRVWTNAVGGTITGDAGSTLELGGKFANAGAISITGGNLFLDAMFNFGGQIVTFTNTGTITAANSTIHIRGNETVAQIGTINRTGGSILYERGTLDNTGGALGAATASLIGLKLDGATIHGGTLNQTGLGLTFSGHTSNTLDAVTVLGGLDIINGTARLAGGTTVKNAANTALAQINVTNGMLALAGDTPFTLAQTIRLANGNLTVDTSGVQGSLTIGATGVVRGSGQIFDQGFPYADAISLTNGGKIIAAGGDLRVAPLVFTNNALMQAEDGATLRVNDGIDRAWTNAASGMITGGPGSTLTLGGKFTNAGGVVIDHGTLNLDATANFGGQLLAGVNNGTIAAENAIINMRGNWSGTGSISAVDQTTINIFGSVAAGQVFKLNDATSVLKLSQPGQFDGTIENFNFGDKIDLINTPVDAVSFAGGVLTAKFLGADVATFNLTGDFTGASFSVVSDGASGSLITTNAGPVYNGVLRLFGPSNYNYVGMLPDLALADSAVLTNLGGGRQQYLVTYSNGIKVAFEGTGLTLGGGGQFDPAGGKVDKITVTDSTIAASPVKVAEFLDDTAHGNRMVIPFDDALIAGGPKTYELILSGDNHVIGGPNDDLISDDLGNNVIDGGGGFNTLIFGPEVTGGSITSGTLQNGTIRYIRSGFEDAAREINKIVSFWQTNFGGGGGTSAGPTGGMFKDPHVNTFDGLYYDFMQKGEFVLARTTVPGDVFEVQARMAAYNNSDSITAISQVGLKIGTHRITFDGARADMVRVDGVAPTLTNGVLDLGEGILRQVSSGVYQVRYYSGETVRVEKWGGIYLDAIVSFDPGHPGSTVVGLLGDNDGNSANDLRLADGTVLTQPLTATQMYGALADAWRVTQATSLLDYGAGQTTATFTDLNTPRGVFSLKDVPKAIFEQAAMIGVEAGIADAGLLQQAVLDYVVTGDRSVFASAAAAEKMGVTTAAITQATTTEPTPTSLGVAPVSPTVTMSAGAQTQVSFTVYRMGEASGAVTVNYAVVAGGVGYFDAADLGGSFPTGQVTLLNGQTSAIFTINIPNAGVTLADERLRVQITAPAGTSIFAPNAETDVINTATVPGIHAIAGYQLLNGDTPLIKNGNAWTLDLGLLTKDQAFAALKLAASNFAVGPANLMSGSFALAGDGGFSVTNADPFLKLAAGDIDLVDVAVNTAGLGRHTQTIALHSTESNVTGFNAALADQTLTITSIVGGSNVINGTPLDNQPLNGAATADVINGLAGNDILRGLAGIDILDGGAGTDLASAEGATGMVYVDLRDAPFNFLDGTGSFDVILNIEGAIGGSGADFLNGDNGANTLRGGGATDAILGRGGNDAIDGGDGDDYLMGGDAYDPAQAGSGNDTIDGGDGTDIIFGMDGNDVINGGAGADFVLAGAGDDTIDGGTGNDFLFGGSAYIFNQTGAGNDTISGGDGVDLIVGSAGADRLNGDAGNDIVYGGAGADFINSAPGVNLAAAGAGDDSLFGDAGNDVIAGGAGFDYIYGGTGADTFVFRKGDSYDAIFDFSKAEGDKIRLDPALGATNFAQFQAKLSGFTFEGVAYTVLNFPASIDQLTIKGISHTAWTAAMVEFA